MTNTPPDLSGVCLSLGFCAGALTRPEVFTAVAEALQNGQLRADYVVFLRDTLTRALQLAGAEPLPGPSAFDTLPDDYEAPHG